MIKQPFEPALKIQTVLEAVCEHYEIDEKTLLSVTRKADIVEKRQIFQSFAKHFTTLSLDKIGKYKGDRTHATVLHSIETVRNLRETEKMYNIVYTNLEKKLYFLNYLAANATTTISGSVVEFTNDLDVVYTVVN